MIFVICNMKKYRIISFLTALLILLSSCSGSNNADTVGETDKKSEDSTAELTSDDMTTDVRSETDIVTEPITAPVTEPVTEPITAPVTEPVTEPIIEPERFEYKTDISAYEKYIDPEDRDAYIVLVNADNPLDKDYVPQELTDLKDTEKGRTTQQMVLTAAKALEALIIEAKANDCKNVVVLSGYRSYARQEYLFNKYTNNEMEKDGSLTREEAEAIVVKDTCRAGTSEHQTGLCTDICSLKQEFGDTYEAKWLAENCYKFGFILRFPEDKTDITNIIYEPWHFRFVGRYHAERIYKLGMCLEEYTEYLKQN